MNLRGKILSVFIQKQKSIREISKATRIPKSTVHYHKQKIGERIKETGTDFWETEKGTEFTIKLVVSVIYFFGIK